MTKALVFDSGVGGLSVSADIRTHLPDLTQIYVADDAFRPYGDKSESALRARLPGLLTSLEFMCQPDIIIIACNTASTTALDVIRDQVRVPVVGVVPAIKPAAKASESRHIAVLGTPGTVRRKYVGQLIADFAGDCSVRLVGSTALVNEAENKLAGEAVDLGVLRREIAPIFAEPHGDRIDQIVLACTHFPLLRDELNVLTPHKVTWVDSGAAIARRVAFLLGERAQHERSENDLAFLVGPDTTERRKAAFASFGFQSVIGLEPG